MKLIKSIMSAFAIVLATTACAGNSGCTLFLKNLAKNIVVK